MKKDRQRRFGKTQTEYEKWENSPEGVAYWLGDLPVPEAVESVIISTVHQLPGQVREFVYCECCFSCVAPRGGQTCYLQKARQPWLILLGQELQDESVLAHQIAHAWLGHRYDPGLAELRATQQEEDAACDLTREWGFGGCGAETRRRERHLTGKQKSDLPL